MSLKTLSMGTIPFDVPFVPLIYDPTALILCMDRPMPPALLDIAAHSFSVSYIPCITNIKLASMSGGEETWTNACNGHLLIAHLNAVVFHGQEEARRQLGAGGARIEQGWGRMCEPAL